MSNEKITHIENFLPTDIQDNIENLMTDSSVFSWFLYLRTAGDSVDSDYEVKMYEDILSDNELKIIPIFSTILYPSEFVVSDEQTNDLMYLAQTIDWNPKDDVDNVRSRSLHVIKEHKELHWLGESIFDCFNIFKNGVLRFDDTEFVMTTSWLTYTSPGLGSIFHNHNNSMWSGVFYFGNEEGINTGIRFGDFAK